MEIKPEVLSVPVGNTSHLVDAYHVHACPDRYSYRPTRYITFRPTGGAMAAVYQNDVIYVFCPNGALPQHVAPEHRTRVSRYIVDRLAAGLFSHPNDLYRFYVVSAQTAIPLPHRLRSSSILQGHGHFTLAALTSGQPKVAVASIVGM